MKRVFLLFCCIGLFNESGAQVDSGEQKRLPPYLYVQERWVDSVLNSMNIEEKIGQLFMIPCWSRSADSEYVRLSKIIRENHVGGIIFMQGGPVRQAILTNYFQSISKTPLLVSQDAEWGLSMRLDSVINFQKQIMLGAIRDTSLIYEFGKEMARELKRLGVNISFSPVVDVNNNPLNPVIGDRAFGENKFDVAVNGLAYMRGLQDHGIIACAKHFPGHGNTDQDSHKTLPVINSTRDELESTELFPFRQLINAGVGSVMVAHLSLPSLDSVENLPSTLSPRIVTRLLRNDLNYQGLVITDALNMKGIVNYSKPGMMELGALLAGNDILLFSEDVPAAMQAIKDAIVRKEITEIDISIRVRKILQAKYWCGLHRWQPVELNHLYEDLNSPSAQLLKQQLVENSLVLAHNKNELIPIQRLDTFRFASVTIGDTLQSSFQDMISNYAGVKHFSILKSSAGKKYDQLLDSLKSFNAVFVSLHSMSRNASINYGINNRSLEFLDSLRKRTKVFLTVFGSPYSLQYFDSFDYVLEAFNEDPITQQVAAQAWFGGIGLQGRLPVTSSGEYFRGRGFTTLPFRIKYSLPEDAGISSEALLQIDKIALEAMEERATPGCQIWVAKDGKVIWNKSYGYFSYDVAEVVENHHLYDLASITKVAATTLMVMKLVEEKKLDLDNCIDDYLPGFKGSNKGKIKLHELLTHQGGLKSYIPFYREALDTSGKLNPEVFSLANGEPFTVEIIPRLYMNRHYIDTMWKRIIQSPQGPKEKYLYSDLDFYFLKRIAEQQAGKPLDQYVNENFYTPLGLSTMCFNPLRFFPVEDIVPSNYDYVFRKDLIQGSVHDQGAAMLGGVAGHAGLFSNANDLGILMQMLLNGGEYAGIRFLDSSTVQEFTSQYRAGNRRGLGFDKPEMQADKPSPTARECSSATFGHQGFTGTCVWVDPEYNLVYVFLSNRTFPDDENGKLNELSIRIRIQEVIYDAMPGIH